MVLGQGVRLAALGLSLGLLVSIWVTFILKHLLQGVSNLDPFSYLLGAAVMLAATLLALVLPALRAARVQPAETLRGE
jgi:ABC-type antimicrobial peptide transport system permease subunit